MKKALFGLLLIAGWLAGFPAHATTYAYNVDYSFTSTPGEVTGLITTTCDSCVLTSSNVPSWSFTASDGTSGSSLNPTAGINASGKHSRGDADGNLHRRQRHGGRVLRVLQRHIEQRIGLLQHSGTQCLQHRSWDRDSGLARQLGGEFVSGRDLFDRRRGYFSCSFHRDCVARRRAGAGGLDDDDPWLCRLRLCRPSPSAA
jgi:hypothetical protein